MDLFGSPISANTRLVDTGVPVDQICQLIVPGNIDNDQLSNILNYLNISTTGLDNSNQAKLYKLQSAVHWEGCTVGNVIDLHKANRRANASALIMSFLTSVRRATMASTPIDQGNSTTIDLLAANFKNSDKRIRPF